MASNREILKFLTFEILFDNKCKKVFNKTTFEVDSIFINSSIALEMIKEFEIFIEAFKKFQMELKEEEERGKRMQREIEDAIIKLKMEQGEVNIYRR